MKSVLAAEFAVLIKLYSVRIILFVFLRVVISLLALSAHQSDLNSCIISHFFGTSIFKIFDRIILTEGNDLCTYLAVVTKQTPSDIEIISIPKWRRVELLEEVERNMSHILAVKSGAVPAQRCGVCEYCRATKIIEEPIDFELVGLSAAERQALFVRF